jgi:hypothetical protein
VLSFLAILMIKEMPLQRDEFFKKKTPARQAEESAIQKR